MPSGVSWITGLQITPGRAWAIFLFLSLVLICISLTGAALDMQASSTLVSNASPESSAMQILGIEKASFPKIEVNLFIDKFCALTGKLDEANFKVVEDNQSIAVDSIRFSGNASGEKLDLAVVFDDTGSMSGEIAALKSRVKDLTGSLRDSGINSSYALVSFKDSVSVKTEWTGDASLFERKVNSLQPEGGDDEPELALDAIAAVLAMGSREGARRIIVVITDAHAHYENDSSSSSIYTEQELKSNLKESGATFILVSPEFKTSSRYVDLRDVANDTQGIWIDIDSAEFSAILEQIKAMLTGSYVIEYTSPDPAPGQNRMVLIAADRRGCVRGSIKVSYISPGSTAVLQAAPYSSRQVLELSISGRLFWDSNGNAVPGIHEEGLEGWKVRLMDGPDGYSTTTTTDREGYYSFTGLASGNYTVAAESKAGWTATNRRGLSQRIELAGGHRAEVDFGFKPSDSDNG